MPYPRTHHVNVRSDGTISLVVEEEVTEDNREEFDHRDAGTYMVTTVNVRQHYIDVRPRQALTVMVTP